MSTANLIHETSYNGVVQLLVVGECTLGGNPIRVAVTKQEWQQLYDKAWPEPSCAEEVMTYEEFEAAMLGIFAYDTGCRSSGIHDAMLKERCLDALELQGGAGEHSWLTRLLFEGVAPWSAREGKADTYGLGIADVAEFMRWLQEDLELDLG